MIQACWRNVGSRRRNVKGNAEIVQLLNKEEDMMKEAKPFEQSFNASKTNKTITAMDIYVIVLLLDKNASAIRKYRM